jgi:hypothetical protein
LFLQLALPVLVLLEDCIGTGTEGSMIEEDDVWVEKKLGGEILVRHRICKELIELSG